mgnify:CR=1 FL=1
MAAQKKLDKSAFNQAVAVATQALVQRLSVEYTNEISTAKWEWVDGKKRDIVDTGRLRASQTVRRVDDAKFEFSWPVEYATQVHEGAKLKGGGEWPARPWTKTALENVDPKSFFETILKRELSG